MSWAVLVDASEIGSRQSRENHVETCKIYTTYKIQGDMYIWVFPKIGGKPPKWMVYNGKPY